MNTWILAPIAVALALLGGCATRGPVEAVPPSDRFALAAQPQVLVVHHLPHKKFWMVGSGSRFLGPLGVMSTMVQSASVQKNLDLQDPIMFVKERMIAVLQRDIGLTNLRAVPEVPKDAKINAMKENFRSGVVLDLQTAYWGTDNYRVKYTAHARLINLDESKELWSRDCDWVIVDKKKPAPEQEALYADNGALLKANLRQAAEICARQLALRLMSPGDHPYQ